MENFPKIDIFPRLTHLKRIIGHILLGPDLLSPISDHFTHPLDTEIKPVTDWPENEQGKLPF